MSNTTLAAPVDASYLSRSRGRFFFVTLALILLLIWGLLLNVNTGSADIPALDVFRMIWNAAKYKVLDAFTGRYGEELKTALTGSMERRIIFSIRMPRMLLAAVLGGALSLSGFLLQTFFRNPMAGPFVLGISSGSRMLVGILIIFASPVFHGLSNFAMVIAAFAGSLLIVSVVLLFAQKLNNMSMLLVIGIMMGYICSAVTDFCITFASEKDIAELTGWSMGSFSGATWSAVGYSAALCLAGLGLSWLLSKPIGAYALGEGYALSLGINLKLFRTCLILLTSLLSASVIAFAGPISFVGIAVPHIARSLLKTSRPARVIPVTFLCGAAFCMFCDLIARTAFAPTEMAIGTVTSFFGAPVVIYMMLTRRRAKGAAA